MPSLTSHLLSLDPSGLAKATQHPFLTAAATSTLPQSKLRHWLAQDRLYALSYVNFIGTLLAQISVPTSSNREQSIEWRIADALIDALDNIRREIHLFEEIAEKEGFKEDICNDSVECGRATRCYQDLFAGSVSFGRPLIVGLVVLWGTEECYLRSWKFAKSHCAENGEGGKGEGDVMQRVLIPNWTSPEFEAFVRRLGGLVNKLCNEWGVEEGGFVWKECENAWKQVVWCEGEFWPEC